MRLNELSNKAGARKLRQRAGRGLGTGRGGTCGRGHKGQKSRSGVALKGFEGGQMPLHRRLPKRGFHNLFAKRFQVVNLGSLQQAIDSGRLDAQKPVTPAALIGAGIVRKLRDGVRLLARGKITSKVTVEVAGASKAAIEAVEQAGGKVIVTAKTKTKTKTRRDKAKKVTGGEGAES